MMNRRLRGGLVRMLLGAPLACASAAPSPKTPAAEEALECRRDILDPRELRGAPTWVSDCTAFSGAAPDVLCAVGKSGEPSHTLAQGVATAMARRELAASLEAHLSSMLAQREQSDTSVGQTTRGSQTSQSVEEAVDGTVRLSKVRGEWISPCGTLHALVVLEPSAVERARADLGAP